MFDKIRQAKLIANAIVQKFESDEKGETPIKALLGLFVVAILAGALVPTAIDTLAAGEDATNWSTSEVAMYGIISIMVLVGVVMLLVRIATE